MILDPGALPIDLVGDGEEIIHGADLEEPFEKHNLQALRWWLLCRGMNP